MTNLPPNLSNLSTKSSEEKKILLEKFTEVANLVSPKSGLTIEIGGAILRQIAFKTTRWLQILGYNNKIISEAVAREKPIIFNIGCGDFIQENMLSIDIIPTGGELLKLVTGKRKLKNDLFIDITYKDKKLAGTADGIVLSHVLEHIPPTLTLTSLSHCFDYLKLGGAIRISVPYLGAYDKTNPNFPGWKKLGNRTLAINRLIYGWGHRFMYDPEILALLMEEAGFKDVQFVSFGVGLLQETDNPTRRSESIYLTGIKS